MEVSDYTIDDFLRDMAPFNLSYWKPKTIYNLLVFCSKEGEGEGGNQEYLKLVLRNYVDYSREKGLIQFWAPTTISSTIGGRCVLKTSNQPFGIKRIERGVCEYRKYCASLEFNIFQDGEKEYDAEFGSIIGRVYRDRKAECNLLLGDFALKYGIRRSEFLPVFKPSGHCCSGVLEISVTYESILLVYKPARDIFKETNLTKPSPLKLPESIEIEDINKALQVVCTTHQLPLAQIWIPCCTSTAMAYVDSPGERCHSPYLSCGNKFSFQNANANFHAKMEAFNRVCKGYGFRTGQGIVGKALLYHKPCFCRDVTQLPKAEYPFSLYARSYGLTGCYAIWLHSTCTKNHDYVLEFYLSHWNTISRDPQTYLELLLATVKKQLPGFKIGSVEEESSVEVCEFFVNNDDPDSFMISHTTSVQPIPKSFTNERETAQNEGVGETVIDKGSNIPGSEQHSVVVCHSEKIAGEELFVEAVMNDEITISLPPMPESLRNENEVVQQLSDDEPTMEEAVRKNESNVAIVKQTSAGVAFSERIFGGAEASEREYRTTGISLSREDLIKHFGKKLGDAARILGVSRSTMKRACRLHKIEKWPFPKRKKGNALRVHSCNEGIEGTYKGNPSCSDPPPLPAKAGISHKTSNSRQEQDVGTVTVKATHGDDIIRFQLPFLSRKTDLVEKLTTRLLLNEGSFNIKYQDEENEWVLIACDEDLEECIGIWKGKSIIKMLVQPITNQAS